MGHELLTSRCEIVKYFANFIPQRQAAAKAEDLHQNGIDIELMSMNRHSHTFDDDQFYKDILFTDDDENTVRPDPADKFEELMSKYVCRRSNVIEK